jgi:hypothetical protein
MSRLEAGQILESSQAYSALRAIFSNLSRLEIASAPIVLGLVRAAAETD